VITDPADGESTDTTPVVSGTGEPGATVDLIVDGEVSATTAVTGDGRWSLTPANALTCGHHTLTAVQSAVRTSPLASLDSLVVSSAPSDPVTIDVDCGTGSGTGPGGGDTGALADTGASVGVGLVGLLGLAALVGGTTLVRRRRR
jgi:hypothetical protein